ncbi:MAG TPA: response regulator, partial [Myxococcota bacterium]
GQRQRLLRGPPPRGHLVVILIVDDNPTNVRLLQLVLRSEGWSMRVAYDATEAMFALRERLPRLILMDLQLPGVDGLSLTLALKADERYRAIPIVAVTSYAMKGDEERAREAGCDGYVTKPIDTRTLPALIRGFLERHD